MTPSASGKPRVVIIGGGFGGLTAARAFRHEAVDVMVIDRNNHHTFQPLLYQVATATLNPSDITAPIRHLLRNQHNTTVLLAEVTSIDAANHKLTVEDSEGRLRSVEYDYLIIAAGARHSYFGHDQWESDAPGLKTIDDALEIRRRFLLALERAEITDDEVERAELMTIVIVGGGPTGVELAGLIPDGTSVSEAAFRVFKGAGDLFPPYAGSFGGGGVVDGPAGDPRTAIVHGGEGVFTPEQMRAMGGGGSPVVVHEHHVYIGGEKVDARIDSRIKRHDKRAGRIAGRGLPGGSGGRLR